MNAPVRVASDKANGHVIVAGHRQNNQRDGCEGELSALTAGGAADW